MSDHLQEKIRQQELRIQEMEGLLMKKEGRKEERPLRNKTFTIKKLIHFFSKSEDTPTATHGHTRKPAAAVAAPRKQMSEELGRGHITTSMFNFCVAMTTASP